MVIPNNMIMKFHDFYKICYIFDLSAGDRAESIKETLLDHQFLDNHLDSKKVAKSI